MQYSGWQNIGGHTFRTSLTDHEAGHHYSGQHHNLAQAQNSLEKARLGANNAREHLGYDRTDGPD